MTRRLIPCLLLSLAAASTATAANHSVVASSFQFTPPNVNAAPGDTVTWTGLSGGFHPVVRTTDASGCTTFGGAGAFNSGGLSSFVFTVPNDAVPGTTIFYKCNNHCACCVMRGTITVIAAPPTPPGAFSLTSPPDGATGVATAPTLQWTASTDATSYAVTVDTDAAFTPPPVFTQNTGAISLAIPSGTLASNTAYFWKVVASNAAPTTTAGSPNPATFTTAAAPPPCPGDADGSGTVNFADVTAVLTNFGSAGPVGDADHNGTVNFADVTAVLTNFGAPCP